MNILKEESKKLGIILNDSQIEKFKIYMDYLLEYNSHTNLTAIKNPEDVLIKHFLDSMILNNFLNIQIGCKVVDVGTGAGFPGVPLKILRDDINLTLIDSLNKRVVFLKELMEKLGLEADIFHGRAEKFGQNIEFREEFDVAVSRAVAPLNVLCEYCLPYVKLGGYFAAFKGFDIKEEIENAKKSLQVLGGKIEKCESFELPLNKGSRSIVIIEKTSNTPKNFPRLSSQISSKPL